MAVVDVFTDRSPRQAKQLAITCNSVVYFDRSQFRGAETPSFLALQILCVLTLGLTLLPQVYAVTSERPRFESGLLKLRRPLQPLLFDQSLHDSQYRRCHGRWPR